MAKPSKKALARYWAQQNSKHQPTFNAPKENNNRITETNHTTYVSSKRFYSDAENLKQQRIKMFDQKRVEQREQSIMKKLIPDTVEASASVGILGIKATWHPKE